MWPQWSASSCPDPSGRRRFAFFAVTLVVVAMLLGKYSLAPALARNWRILIDEQERTCLPFRVAVMKVGRPDTVKKGDFVAFIPHGRMGMGVDEKMAAKPGRRVIVKMVAGVAGDVLKVADDQAYINDKPLGQLDLLQRLGKPPGAFDRTEIVPAKHYALFGTLPRSYDSRYWGFVPHEELVGVIYPLF